MFPTPISPVTSRARSTSWSLPPRASPPPSGGRPRREGAGGGPAPTSGTSTHNFFWEWRVAWGRRGGGRRPRAPAGARGEGGGGGGLGGGGGAQGGRPARTFRADRPPRSLPGGPPAGNEKHRYEGCQPAHGRTPESASPRRIVALLVRRKMPRGALFWQAPEGGACKACPACQLRRIHTGPGRS